MGSPWLPTGPYSVRMKRTAPRKLFKPLLPSQARFRPQNIPKIERQKTSEFFCQKSARPRQWILLFSEMWGPGRCLCAFFCQSMMRCMWHALHHVEVFPFSGYFSPGTKIFSAPSQPPLPRPPCLARARVRAHGPDHGPGPRLAGPCLAGPSPF